MEPLIRARARWPSLDYIQPAVCSVCHDHMATSLDPALCDECWARVLGPEVGL